MELSSIRDAPIVFPLTCVKYSVNRYIQSWALLFTNEYSWHSVLSTRDSPEYYRLLSEYCSEYWILLSHYDVTSNNNYSQVFPEYSRRSTYLKLLNWFSQVWIKTWLYQYKPVNCTIMILLLLVVLKFYGS